MLTNINAVNVTPVSVNPVNIRYSLLVDKFSDNLQGQLRLQRSECRSDGTWMDDPHIGSSKVVPLPTDTGTISAINGLVSLLPTFLSRINVTDSFTNFRLQLNSVLSATGVLDVSATVQLQTAKGW